jgi:hypothetical protein
MRRAVWVVTLAVALIAAVPASGRSLGQVSLNATFIADVSETSCPGGAPDGATCYSATATTKAPGLGTLQEAFVEEITGTDCMHTTFVDATLSVAGKGAFNIALTDPNTCDPDFSVDVSVPFTITGGTSTYSNATGAGTLTFSGFRSTGPTSARETHTWAAQISAGTDFDTTAPEISGAKSITVKSQKKNALVRYTVTAVGAVDGSVPVKCTPKSGSRFTIGHTHVTCRATDGSDNTATARFTVTVKRAR